MEPGIYREILIFVAGTTPQIITETLYGLCVLQEQPVLADELHVITTRRGKALIEEELLGKGRLDAFFREFGLDLALSRSLDIIVIEDPHGEPLDDIREASHNEAVGDLIADFVREKARDPTSRLHCSLAGGRKTMSFYLGSALQLFGRPWDKLYHVLVSPEFESHPDFYYKPRKDRILEVRSPEGKVMRTLHTRDAVITLAELPFIRIGEKVSLEGASFKELVAQGQRDLDAAMFQRELEVRLHERTVRIGPRVIQVVPVQLMLYTAVLKQKTEHCLCPKRPLCLDCTECFPALVDFASREALEVMAEDYKRIYGPHSGRLEELVRTWKEGFDVEALRQNISKINRALREGLDDETLFPMYAVTPVGKHGSKRYGVRAERGKIRIR